MHIFGSLSSVKVNIVWHPTVYYNREGVTEVSNAWTPEEVKVLVERYPDMGTRVIELLPGRTATAINKKVAKLNLRVKEPKPGKSPYRAWTPEELNILVTYYPALGYSVFEMLPNRTAGAIAQKVQQLGLSESQEAWSEEDVKALLELWRTGTRTEVGNAIGRSSGAVAAKAKRLGIAFDQDSWSEAEETILRTYYRLEGNDCLKRLPGRTLIAMQAKARRLKLSDGQPHRNEPRYVDGTFSVSINGVTCTTRQQVADQLGITRIALCSFLNRRENTLEDAIAKYQNRVVGFKVGEKVYATRKELYVDSGVSRHTFCKYEQLYGTEGALKYLKGEYVNG